MRKKNDFRGKTEVESWKSWGAAQGYSVNTLHKWGDIYLRKYFVFCWDNFQLRPENTGWEQVLKFKLELGSDQRKKKTTKNNYLEAVFSYYEFKKDTNPQEFTDLFIKIKTVGKFKRAIKTPYKPLPLDQYRKMLDSAELLDQGDFVFLMVLGYTMGRAQFYGLRQSEVYGSSEPPMIRKRVKGNKVIEIPLHPELQKVLEELIQTRDYTPKNGSDFYFRYGRESVTDLDYAGNQQRAEQITKKYAQICKLPEWKKVTPHRFRKMGVTSGRKLGLNPKEAQIIAGHQDKGTTENIYNMPELQDIYDTYAGINFRKDKQADQSKPQGASGGLGDLLKLLRDLSPADKKLLREALTEPVEGESD